MRMRSVRHIGTLNNFYPAARVFCCLRDFNGLEAVYGLFSGTNDRQSIRGSVFLLILNAWRVIGVVRGALRPPKPDADGVTHTLPGVLSPLRLEWLKMRLLAILGNDRPTAANEEGRAWLCAFMRLACRVN